MPCWVRVVIEAPNTFRRFLKGDNVGNTIPFLLEGDTLKMLYSDGNCQHFTRAREDEAPQWFRDDVAKAIASPPP